MNRDLYSLRATPLSPVSASMHGKSHPNENPTTPGHAASLPPQGRKGHARVPHSTGRRATPASHMPHRGTQGQSPRRARHTTRRRKGRRWATEMYARRLGDIAATPCVRERARDMSMALGQGERGAPRRGGGEGPGRYGSHAVRQRASSRGQMLPDPKAQWG